MLNREGFGGTLFTPFLGGELTVYREGFGAKALMFRR